MGLKVVEYYKQFLPAANIKTVFNLTAEHTMPTVSYGNNCTYKGSPYIGKCGYVLVTPINAVPPFFVPVLS